MRWRRGRWRRRALRWITQRTRWFKGWMQAWIVHMRRPIELWRQLGTAGFVIFQRVAGGSVLAALVHPVFVGILVVDTVFDGTPARGLPHAHYGARVRVRLRIFGRARPHRTGPPGFLSWAWVMVLIPLYRILLSIAAGRAVYKPMTQPFQWEKTAHGLAKTWPAADAAESA